MLFTGFILTPDGPKVLEYNVRFGDPETQALMLLLDDETDLAEVMLVCVSEHDFGQVLMYVRPVLGMCGKAFGFRQTRLSRGLRCVCGTRVRGVSWALRKGCADDCGSFDTTG